MRTCLEKACTIDNNASSQNYRCNQDYHGSEYSTNRLFLVCSWEHILLPKMDLTGLSCLVCIFELHIHGCCLISSAEGDVLFQTTRPLSKERKLSKFYS